MTTTLIQCQYDQIEVEEEYGRIEVEVEYGRC